MQTSKRLERDLARDLSPPSVQQRNAVHSNRAVVTTDNGRLLRINAVLTVQSFHQRIEHRLAPEKQSRRRRKSRAPSARSRYNCL